jgi:hypothetical protein
MEQKEIIMSTAIHNRTKYILKNNDIFESIKKRLADNHMGATIIVPHVCNNIDLFGAGFAAQVAQHYPEVKANYHMLGKSFLKNNLGYSQILKVHEEPKYRHKLYFVNMIAQNGVRNRDNLRPLNYAALVGSMMQVSKHIQMNTGFLHKNENVEIHAPKFGSGLAGGDWRFISDLIEDIWGKYQVYIYSYNK